MKLLIKILSVIIPGLIFLGCTEKKDSFISFDDDGMLNLNGERIFIVGSYHHPKTDNPFLSLSENGYNYVRSKANKNELDSAAKYNLMTWISTGSIKEKDRSERTTVEHHGG